MHLIYKNAVEGLRAFATKMIMPDRSTQSFIQSYARRYSNELDYMT